MEFGPITIDPAVLGGTPVFTGTRVPVKTLFDYLEGGDPIDVFLADYPTVTREQTVSALMSAAKALGDSKVLHALAA
jgi:uncharacterized protein (DUF433 family)